MKREAPQYRAYIDYYKITPKGLVIWKDCYSTEGTDFNNSHLNFFEPDRETTYQGEMTHHAKRRLAQALTLLIEISREKWETNPTTGKRFKFRLAFQTLTLSAPQNELTDRQIKEELLQPYLRKQRRRGMKNYVWKAEQQQNGNIHFHIITDVLINHTNIRDDWNNLQSKLGFISAFERKHGHRDPNSIDVKSVRNENVLTKYLLKYMLKDSDKTKQLRLDKNYSKKAKGKIWDCSQNLKLKNSHYEQITNELYSHLSKLENENSIKCHHDDYYKFYFFNAYERKKYLPENVTFNYTNYIESVRNYK